MRGISAEFQGRLLLRALFMLNARSFPVAIIDSYKAFDIHSVRKMTAQIHYLEPLTYEEYKGMKTVEIAAIVKSRIEDAIKQYAPEKSESFSN